MAASHSPQPTRFGKPPVPPGARAGAASVECGSVGRMRREVAGDWGLRKVEGGRGKGEGGLTPRQGGLDWVGGSHRAVSPFYFWIFGTPLRNTIHRSKNHFFCHLVPRQRAVNAGDGGRVVFQKPSNSRHVRAVPKIAPEGEGGRGSRVGGGTSYSLLSLSPAPCPLTPTTIHPYTTRIAGRFQRRFLARGDLATKATEGTESATKSRERRRRQALVFLELMADT